MFVEHSLKHFHPSLNIGVEDIRNVWILGDPPVRLSVSLHRGLLAYRLPGSRKRISYRTLKKGLIKKKIIIRQPVPILPF